MYLCQLLSPVLTIFLVTSSLLVAADWPNWRGPLQSGVSLETGLPDSWSPQGKNLLWKAPFGGRSAPIVMEERVYMLTHQGKGSELQELVLCLEARTGQVLWKHAFNIYQSDVPPHRVGWASPTGDPSTGRIYVQGVCGVFLCLDRQGHIIWIRYLAEEFGLISTHGGRTPTPVIFEDLVITSGLTSGWGKQARGGHRYLAFDKTTGDLIWIRQPGGRPHDTTYSTPVLQKFQGRTLILDGNGDGGIYAMTARTGLPIWSFPLSKRGINSSVTTDGQRIYANHGEENIESSDMGRLVSLNLSGSGKRDAKSELWRANGIMASYASAVLHEGRLLLADNAANLFSFDTANGHKMWQINLGTIQRASPVLADQKIYLGTANGRFFILKPGERKCEILDQDDLSETAGEEEIFGSVAVSNGRVYLTSTQATYCLGQVKIPKIFSPRHSLGKAELNSQKGPISLIQVIPAEVLLAPGETISFRARAFDNNGNVLIGTETDWMLQGIEGKITPEGKFSSRKAPQAGLIKASSSGISATARIRIVPPFPWSEDFEMLPLGQVPSHWVGAPGKFKVGKLEESKVLIKTSDNPFLQRARLYMGSWHHSDYTIEASIRGTEKRRRMPDIGIVAQRYALILYGNHQSLRIEGWAPEIQRTEKISFMWNPDVWYRMKLRIETPSPNRAIIRGKVWPITSHEPDEWSIVKEDPVPNIEGSPGLYAYAHTDAFFDDIKVYSNNDDSNE